MNIQSCKFKMCSYLHTRISANKLVNPSGDYHNLVNFPPVKFVGKQIRIAMVSKSRYNTVDGPSQETLQKRI